MSVSPASRPRATNLQRGGIVLAALVVAAAVVGFNRWGRHLLTPTPPPGPLDGTYLLVGLEIGGTQLNDAISHQENSERKLHIRGDQMVSYRNGDAQADTFTLDPSRSPAEIDVTQNAGEEGQRLLYGIYKQEGDTLTICVSETGLPAQRPKEFKTGSDTHTLLMTFQKQSHR